MNKILEDTKAAILNKADKRLHGVIEKIVSAGHDIMYSEKTRDMVLGELGDGKDPEVIGAGVAKLVAILYNQSKKTAPVQALIPAAVILLCEGLDFLEQAGAVQVTADFLSKCTLALGSTLAQMFGATPGKMQPLFDKGASMVSSKQGAPATKAPAPQQGGIVSRLHGVAA